MIKADLIPPNGRRVTVLIRNRMVRRIEGKREFSLWGNIKEFFGFLKG